jgi:hypothetical protein
MKLDLLTNSTVDEDAIRFISSNKSKEMIKSSSDNSNKDYKKESNKRDYDEDQQEEEQEREAGEITNAATTNEVFDNVTEL